MPWGLGLEGGLCRDEAVGGWTLGFSRATLGSKAPCAAGHRAVGSAQSIGDEDRGARMAKTSPSRFVQVS